ncbi:MAG TPA: flavin reductase [Candidatus Butyricicoccus avicola]|nr:flavin reductase [Candidatus Butyricicoccus avicola]
MDRAILDQFDYGLYLASATAGGKQFGCIVNSLSQVTSASPEKFSLALNQSSATKKAIDQAGVLSITLIGASCPDAILNEFGYKSGRAIDKFSKFETFIDAQGSPYLKEGMVARIAFRVIDKLDAGTHTLYMLEVIDAEAFSTDPVMTVRAWNARGNEAPPAAPVFRTLDKKIGWKCTVCGYIYPKEELPEGYHCPICHAPASKFVKL